MLVHLTTHFHDFFLSNFVILSLGIIYELIWVLSIKENGDKSKNKSLQMKVGLVKYFRKYYIFYILTKSCHKHPQLPLISSDLLSSI